MFERPARWMRDGAPVLRLCTHSTITIIVHLQATYKPDLWIHFGDPSINIAVKVTEDLDKMKEHDFLSYMPSVSGGDGWR
jgi:hypothetical protein